MQLAQDATLPRALDQRVFIAANFKNNGDLMPHFIQQLLLAIVAMPSDNAFVSIYESGSTDLTGTAPCSMAELQF